MKEQEPVQPRIDPFDLVVSPDEVKARQPDPSSERPVEPTDPPAPKTEKPIYPHSGYSHIRGRGPGRRR